MIKKSFFSSIPWWLVLLAGSGIILLATALSQASYRVIFGAVLHGLGTTVYAAFIAYLCSLAFGLLLGLARASSSKLVREVATLYIEVIRGLPMLVILYYIAFVGAPFLASACNVVLMPFIKAGYITTFTARDFSFTARAVFALCLGYSAFIAEIFRAGIESVPKGQVEAAHALSLSKPQTMRHIILPQATRNVLPALANEFIAIIKDTALLSVLGVQDITQIGKVYAASTFMFFETYNVVAFFYLCLTISLSLLVRKLEAKLKRNVPQ